MTENQADKAHECWEELYDTLRDAAFAVMEKYKLNDEQRQYVENKLHEELRYWR